VAVGEVSVWDNWSCRRIGIGLRSCSDLRKRSVVIERNLVASANTALELWRFASGDPVLKRFLNIDGAPVVGLTNESVLTTSLLLCDAEAVMDERVIGRALPRVPDHSLIVRDHS